MSPTMTLAEAPFGESLTLMRAEGSPDLCRRLAALGLRRGAQLSLVHRTAGGGRVVNVAGSRIALDRGMLQRLHAEPSVETLARVGGAKEPA
ncbi:FeoA family protein [Luteococcus peritonei]|uniref:Ferrous iron transport protein A n=1 Tax=Luteococcus peritonei TaxID=88874 RepID=A0ABW4RVY8_9ACTN